MNIVEALQAHDSTLRLDASGRWLVWDEVDKVWVVYGSSYRKGVEVVYYGDSEDVAVAVLMGVAHA